jgi:hypothetical protein
VTPLAGVTFILLICYDVEASFVPKGGGRRRRGELGVLWMNSAKQCFFNGRMWASWRGARVAIDLAAMSILVTCRDSGASVARHALL